MSRDDPSFVESMYERRESTHQLDLAITLGIEPVSASDTHVEMSMPFRREIATATGVFAAGALIQLADVAATILCARVVEQRGGGQGTFFPYAIQMNAHLVGNSNSGRAIARSTLLSAGKTVMVAHTPVRNEQGKDLILLTSTHIIKSIES